MEMARNIIFTGEDTLAQTPERAPNKGADENSQKLYL
jgi:hypothetical protein